MKSYQKTLNPATELPNMPATQPATLPAYTPVTAMSHLKVKPLIFSKELAPAVRLSLKGG